MEISRERPPPGHQTGCIFSFRVGEGKEARTCSESDLVARVGAVMECFTVVSANGIMIAVFERVSGTVLV